MFELETRTATTVPDGSTSDVTAVVGATLAGPARRGEVITDVRLLGPQARRIGRGSRRPDRAVASRRLRAARPDPHRRRRRRAGRHHVRHRRRPTTPGHRDRRHRRPRLGEAEGRGQRQRPGGPGGPCPLTPPTRWQARPWCRPSRSPSTDRSATAAVSTRLTLRDGQIHTTAGGEDHVEGLQGVSRQGQHRRPVDRGGHRHRVHGVWSRNSPTASSSRSSTASAPAATRTTASCESASAAARPST